MWKWWREKEVKMSEKLKKNQASTSFTSSRWGLELGDGAWAGAWVILESFWVILELFWVILESTWVILESYWVILGSPWGHPGLIDVFMPSKSTIEWEFSTCITYLLTDIGSSRGPTGPKNQSFTKNGVYAMNKRFLISSPNHALLLNICSCSTFRVGVLLNSWQVWDRFTKIIVSLIIL